MRHVLLWGKSMEKKFTFVTLGAFLIDSETGHTIHYAADPLHYSKAATLENMRTSKSVRRSWDILLYRTMLICWDVAAGLLLIDLIDCCRAVRIYSTCWNGTVVAINNGIK